jgi:hypothetical protein
MAPVTLPAAERAIYLELNQLLASNEFMIKKGKVSGGNDRARRIREVLGTSATAGEALMKCASNFKLDDSNTRYENAPEACDIIVRLRQSQYKSLKADLRKKLKQAEWLERECSTHVRQYLAWKIHAKSNQLGDDECMKEIKTMIDKAELGYRKDDWIEFYVTPQQMADRVNAETAAKAAAIAAAKKAKAGNAVEETESEEDLVIEEESESGDEDLDDEEEVDNENGLGHSPIFDTRGLKPEGIDENKRMECVALVLRDVTNDLRKLSSELVSRKRCLRFFQCVRNIQNLSTALRNNKLSTAGCSCSKCEKNLLPHKASVLSQCGHTICKECANTYMDRQDDCPISACNAVNKTYQVIPAPELGIEDDRTRVGRHYGKKLEDIIHLIKRIPRDEQVLLFVQFTDLAKTIISALEDHKITYLALAELGNASKKLTEFQMNTDVLTKKKVLLLNMGDASAAGR